MKLLRLLPLLFFLAAAGCAEKTATANIDANQLKTAMDNGAEYLVRVTKPSGEFVYLDNLDPERNYKPVYNVLRHAGSMYALADYYAYKPDPQVKSALVRSAKWLQTKYIKPVPNEKNLLAVWALPTDVAGGRGPMEIKLGGIGLGLVGLLGAEKVAPGTTSLETLRQLGNCILWMQNPDGSFYSKYDPKLGGKLDNWTSLYYPGEAALALAMLAEHDPDAEWKKRWINAAFRAVGYLAQIRENQKSVPADHWVLIATAQLWPLHAYSDQSVSKIALIRHAVQICEVIIADPALRADRTTPIATRLEGMLAAMRFLPPEHQALRDTMQKEIERGVEFLMKTQTITGEMKGAIPRGYTPGGGLPADKRVSEVRIDYVQHALSAWLEYSRQSGIIPPASFDQKK